MAALVLAAGFTSCSEDSLDTNQYNKNGVNLLGFGPMPITRGATMRITGTKLNEVQEVLFPEGNQKLTPSTTTIRSLPLTACTKKGYMSFSPSAGSAWRKMPGTG